MRRRLIIVLAGCALAAILTALLWHRDRVPEPQYQGKSFSEWLHLYNQSGIRPGLQGRPEAVHALQQVGTNALPFLLHRIKHETPAWKVRLAKIAPRFPSPIRNSSFFKRLLQDKRAQQADSTISAFNVLGSQAVPAGLELVRLANDKKAPQTARRAWISAALIGKQLPETPRSPPDKRDGQASPPKWLWDDVPKGHPLKGRAQAEKSMQENLTDTNFLIFFPPN
jgi:hypothetical protein